MHSRNHDRARDAGVTSGGRAEIRPHPGADQPGSRTGHERVAKEQELIMPTAVVQVFGCRQERGSGTRSWQACKKREGTKSREVGPRLGSKRYGDLMSAPTLMVGGTQPGSDRDVWTGEVGSPQWASRRALGAHQRALGALIAVIGSREMTAGIEPARRNRKVARLTGGPKS